MHRLSKYEKALQAARVNAIDAINAGNREEECELAALLAPIDRRLTVEIFNKGPFDFEVAVGRDGRVTHQPGTRFQFGVNRLNLRPYVMGEEFCIDFEEAHETALEWLRQTIARTLWNYFHNRPDRVLEAVSPLEAHNAAIEWRKGNEASLARAYA